MAIVLTRAKNKKVQNRKFLQAQRAKYKNNYKNRRIIREGRRKKRGSSHFEVVAAADPVVAVLLPENEDNAFAAFERAMHTLPMMVLNRSSYLITISQDSQSRVVFLLLQ